MRGKLLFLGGLAAGFVLGARAGREKYEEIRQTAQRIKDNPTIQEAAGVVQEQATRLYSESKDKVNDKLANSRLVGARYRSSGLDPDTLETTPIEPVPSSTVTTGPKSF